MASVTRYATSAESTPPDRPSTTRSKPACRGDVEARLRTRLGGRVAHLPGPLAHDPLELAQDDLRPLVAQQRRGDPLAAQVGQVHVHEVQPLVVERRPEARVPGRADDLRTAPEADRLVHADAVDEDDIARRHLRVGPHQRAPRGRGAQPELVDRGHVAARRRGDVDEHLGAIESQELRHREMPEVLAHGEADAHAKAARHGPDERAGGEEAPFVEEAVGGQEDLAMNVVHGAVLEQRRGDEETMVGRLLHEGDHRGQAHRLGRQGRKARVIEPHRDLGREILQQVPGQTQLGEDDEPGAARPRLGKERAMALEVRLERAELRGGLGEGDAERLHAARESSGPRAGQAPATWGPAGGRGAAEGTGGPGARIPMAWTCSVEPSTSSAKWQATSWPLERTRRLGSSATQRSGLPSRSRSPHPLRNPHPQGGFTGLGTSPLRMIRRRRASTAGSGMGMADRSATAYGGTGRWFSYRDGATSTMRPSDFTSIRLLMWRTTERSWAMKR